MESKNQHIDNIDLLTKYFAGEASVEEQISLDKWKEASENNKAQYDEFSKIWAMTGDVSNNDDIDIELEWKKLEETIVPKKVKTITLNRLVQIAAIFIIVSVIGFIAFQQMQLTSYKTAMVDTQEISLPDGSVIYLNANSRLTYDKEFGINHRNVTLTGEAFFKVATDSSAPFIINANGAQIEVVGTEFNVKAYKDRNEVKVYVKKGAITLYDKNKRSVKTLLTAGESGIYNKQNRTTRKELEANLNDIAWRTMVIELDETPMWIVKEILESTYHVQIDLADNIKNCPVTAEFDNDNLTVVLKIIIQSLENTKFKSDGKKVIITGKGC